MPWTLGQVVDRTVFEGIDEPEAIQIANQRYAELVRRSGSLRGTENLGDSDGAETYFEVPTTVARVLHVWVDLPDGSDLRYAHEIGSEEMRALRSSGGGSGQNCYAAIFGYTNKLLLQLSPTPPVGRVFIEAEKLPEPLVDRSDELVIPDEFVQGLLDGIQAVVMRSIDEDLGSSQALEQSFENCVSALTDYRRARTVSNYPVAIPQRGVHW